VVKGEETGKNRQVSKKKNKARIVKPWLEDCLLPQPRKIREKYHCTFSEEATGRLVTREVKKVYRHGNPEKKTEKRIVFLPRGRGGHGGGKERALRRGVKRAEGEKGKIVVIANLPKKNGRKSTGEK